MKFPVSFYELLVGILAAVLFGMLGGYLIGRKSTQIEIHQEAVKAGVARWVAGPDGQAKFEWIGPSEKKP